MKNWILFCILSCFLKLSNAQNKTDCDPKCVSQIAILTYLNIGSFPKSCSTICANIYIDGTANLSPEQLKIAFKDIKVLKGILEIKNTTYKNLSFLAGLQKIYTGPYSVNISNNPELEELGLTSLTSINGIFQVTSNPKLRKLKLPKLKTTQLSNPWVNDTAVAIAGSSPQFCLALREAKILLNYKKVTSFMFDSKVCQPGRQAKKACIVPKMGCVNFIGNLKIGPKFDFKKVKSLKFIYGSIIVKNSSLTDFKIFENLLEIVQMNSTKLAIDVQGNKNLQNATFPKLKRIYTANTVGVLFKNNRNSLKLDSKSCFSIRLAMLRAGPVCTCSPIFDDLKCEEMEQWKKQTGGK